MSFLPKINLRRTFLIARRDYLGYVKTWGFWISFLLPFLFGAFAFFMARADIDLTPTQYVAVLDETNAHIDGLNELYDERLEDAARAALSVKAFFIQDKEKRTEFSRILQIDGTKAAQNYIAQNNLGVSTKYEAPTAEFKFITPPAETLKGLLPYLSGEIPLIIDGEETELGGVIIFKSGSKPSEPKTEYWSTNVSKLNAPDLVDRYLQKIAQENYLGTEGLNVAELERRKALAPKTEKFNPTKTAGGDQGVNKSDTVPFAVATVLAFMK